MRPVAGGTLRGDEVGNLFTRLPPPHYARARCPVPPMWRPWEVTLHPRGRRLSFVLYSFRSPGEDATVGFYE